MRIGYHLGRFTRGAAKAVLPVSKWATQQVTTFTSEFVQGMSETPTLATDKTIEQDKANNSNVDEQLKQELSSDSEPVQLELPLDDPQQPVRES
tara:strand:- start:116 stop:397 length:282 start_codon:yes stop_codon:yes gene_type:complete